MDSKLPDKRLADRFLRTGQLDRTAYAKQIDSLPESSENVAPRSDEEIEAIRSELTGERDARELRIQRALEEPAAPVPLPEPVLPEGAPFEAES